MPQSNQLASKAANVVAGAAVGAFTALALSSQPRWLLESGHPRAIFTETDPISQIPSEADVVVIGGGIAGISTALFLNEYGLRTVVFEKGFVGGESSSRNFGWVYSNGFHEDKLPLAVDAKNIWTGLANRFGFDVSVRQGGNLQLASNEEELEAQRAWQREASQRFPKDIDAKILRASELDELIPRASAKYIGALHQPSDGSAEPTHAVPLIAKGARAEGVKVFAPVAVRAVETEGGAVHSVVTEHGEVRTKRVVVAGGAWSRLFLGNLGINLPQQNITSNVIRVKGGTAHQGAGHGGGVAWREQIDGSYSIGVTPHPIPVTWDSFRVLPDFMPALRQLLKNPLNSPLTIRVGSDLLQSMRTNRRWRNDEITEFERVRMLTAKPLMRAGDRAVAATREFFPALADARIIERWAGVIDATPDYTSVISEVPAMPGLFINTGHGAQGFALGPGAGRLAAQLVAEQAPLVDPEPFRLSRFSDGQPLLLREFL
ncbi:FAD-binding oxidoreductase [Arthrobacter sp. CAU 1506]|uniref:NAD(P)/FAD-dependent oxidoreductase n=1 Tax=Arthrobacter sp. CAU 1506 TaxID=2560052 RepID=UPI0010AD2260|nr:FAD-binding oxidoreductase [Arthrobacter sp. CAU 1506]TJY66244.1 FAD-binding oxidoreductase [Arthrobacter sp. CAU 1506]